MISVVIQGGGMRSVYCLGAVRAIAEQLDLSLISSIHSASGGCVAASLLSSLCRRPDPGYSKETADSLVGAMASRRFIDGRRISKIVDLDYLLKIVVQMRLLDTSTLRRDGPLFEVAVTDALTAEARYLAITGDVHPGQVEDSLRASMAIPFLYPRTVRIDGQRFLDGGISDPLPVFRALNHGATKIIALGSKPLSKLGLMSRGREAAMIRHFPGIPTAVRNLLLTNNPLARLSAEVVGAHRFGNVEILEITPSDEALIISRTEIDLSKVRALELLGCEDARRALSNLGWRAP